MTLWLEVQNPEGFASAPIAAQLQTWAQAAWPQTQAAAVTLRIVGLDEGRQLNRDFRGRDQPTNVLSFPWQADDFALDELDEPLDELTDAGDEEEADLDAEAADEPPYLGDLAICLPVVEREAAEQGKPPLHHWAHLLVHGLLHLQGFDHEQEADAEAMEAREIAILAQLGLPDPYATSL